MKVNFYDTRVRGNRTVLVKEGSADYSAEPPSSPESAVKMLNQLTSLDSRGEENCYIIALNTRNRPLGIFFLSKGTASLSIVGPRETFLRALLIGATHIILFHNHPSSICVPSRDDITVTERIKNAGELIGIPLTDHIIVGKGDYYSFREHGKL